ncbi:MAG: D-inositol-3-phosphate glycosyltransferase [Planctomycetes bacterium]|nr:D-inositol-3-phosphate glycosyltransferase [Planctomycetota bacterium]
MTPIRVLMIDPYGAQAARGNSVSAARIEAALRADGHDIVRVTAASTTLSALRRLVRAERFDVVHAIHAFRTGALAREAAAPAGLPLVVSFRGTDAEQGLAHPCLRPLVERAVRSARVVTVLTDDQAARVRAAFPDLAAAVRVVPHGVDVSGASPAGVRARLGIPEDARMLAHIAGIRPEKGFPEAWGSVDAARAACPGFYYVHAGPLIDASLGAGAERWFAERTWARRLGSIPRERALDVVAAADATLHASRVEGLSNALLESLALAVPVIARDIPATRFVVTDGCEGRIFRDDASLAAALSDILCDCASRREMSAAALATASRFSVAAETAGYVAAFRDAMTLTGT